MLIGLERPWPGMMFAFLGSLFVFGLMAGGR